MTATTQGMLPALLDDTIAYQRWPFTKALPPVHSSGETQSVIPSLPSPGSIKPFLNEHSTLRGLKLCSRRQPCKSRLCPWCSTRKASQTRADLRREAVQHASVLNLTLSVSSSPSFSDAWVALAATRAEFTRSRWLATKSTSRFRQTEVTHTEQGWHLHDNWLLFGDDQQLHSLLTTIIPRWLDSASRTGTTAHPLGQHATLTPHKSDALSYTSKGLLAQHASHTSAQGRTPGDLLALFHAGDADAAEAWHELESFFKIRGHRWVATGGNLRGKS